MFSGAIDKDKEATVGPVLVVVLLARRRSHGKAFRVSRREDQEKRCLVGNPSGREGDGVAGWDSWNLKREPSESRCRRKTLVPSSTLQAGVYAWGRRAGKEPRPEMEMTKKESLILLPRRRGRRRRVKRPRKTAIWLRLCTSAKLQSS